LILIFLITTAFRIGFDMMRRPGLTRLEGMASLSLLSAWTVAIFDNSLFQSAVLAILFWLFFGIAAGRTGAEALRLRHGDRHSAAA